MCRYVRQESPLWSALHNGVLTSSTLNGALGFYEPGAVQRLGLPKHFVRHGALLAAYSNLLQPEYVPPSQVCWTFSTDRLPVRLVPHLSMLMNPSSMRIMACVAADKSRVLMPYLVSSL